MARTLIDILDKHDLYPGDIVAENREGGSGAVGWGYLYNQAGNPYAISTTSGSYIPTPPGRHAVGARTSPRSSCSPPTTSSSW